MPRPLNFFQQTRRLLPAAALSLLAAGCGGAEVEVEEGLDGEEFAAASTTDEKRAYRYEFNISNEAFITLRASRPAPFNWSTDKCSVPVPVVKQLVDRFFTNQCIRHDFGYRNWRYLRWAFSSDSERTRRAIDDQLLADMRDRCSAFASWNPLRAVCYDASITVYGAVRQFGQLH